MEPVASIDLAVQDQAAAKRSAALAVLAKTTPGAMVALQAPVWFAVLILALISVTSYRTATNPGPYLVGPIIVAVGFLSVYLLKMQRRLEALVQLVSQDLK